MENGKNLRRRRSPEAALAKPGMRHYKLKNVSWSLSPALAPSSAEQEGDVSYSVHSSAKTSEIMPRKPLLSPWDPYSHMQLFRTWCTKDKARHHWLKPCQYSLPLVAGTLGAVPRWQSWRLLFMLPTPKKWWRAQAKAFLGWATQSTGGPQVSAGLHGYSKVKKKTPFPYHSICYKLSRAEEVRLC